MDGHALRGHLERLAIASLLAASTSCVAFDRIENPVKLMSTRAVSLDPASDLPAPEGMMVSSTTDRQIALAWDPVLVGDVAGYLILRASVPGEEFAALDRTRSRFDTIFVDRGDAPGSLGDDESYVYRIHAYDDRGRASARFATIQATTAPRPEAPQGLRSYSNLPRRVVLRWTPSPDPGVVGYSILRSPTSAGPWETVGEVDDRLESVHEDAVPGDLRVMYYRLTARNRFGGASDMSDPARAVTKAEPLPPYQLHEASRRLGEVTLAWSPNVEGDLVSYEIYRSLWHGDHFGQERRIGVIPAHTTEFTDAEIGCGERARYRLRARDADRLESSPSNPLEVTGESIGLTASDGELSWRDDLEREGWTDARISVERRLLPDRLLEHVRGASRSRLPGLGPGEHRLAVTLASESPARRAPACRTTIRLP